MLKGFLHAFHPCHIELFLSFLPSLGTGRNAHAGSGWRASTLQIRLLHCVGGTYFRTYNGNGVGSGMSFVILFWKLAQLIWMHKNIRYSSRWKYKIFSNTGVHQIHWLRSIITTLHFCRRNKSEQEEIDLLYNQYKSVSPFNFHYFVARRGESVHYIRQFPYTLFFSASPFSLSLSISRNFAFPFAWLHFSFFSIPGTNKTHSHFYLIWIINNCRFWQSSQSLVTLVDLGMACWVWRSDQHRCLLLRHLAAYRRSLFRIWKVKTIYPAQRTAKNKF